MLFSPSGTSFVVTYNVPTNIAVTLMSATPYLKTNRYSPPVSLNLPIFDAPAWLPALVSCGALACLGSFNNWGASTNIAFVRSVSSNQFNIPFIGFAVATSFGGAHLFDWCDPGSLTVCASELQWICVERRNGVALWWWQCLV